MPINEHKLRNSAYNYALKKDHDNLIPCASRFISNNIRLAMSDALTTEYQKKNPLYCAILCQLLTSEFEDPENIIWYKHAAYNFALAENYDKLDSCAQRLITSNINLAIEDVQNPKYQKENPLYCAALCTILANKFEGSERIAYYRLAVYNFALADNSRIISTADKFIAADINIAAQDALDENIQMINPLYCAYLSKRIAEEFENHGNIVDFVYNNTSQNYWYIVAVYLFALTKDNHSMLYPCAKKIIIINRDLAIKEALNQEHQEKNPLYCATLSYSLAENPEVNENPAIWYKIAAYYYAIAEDYVNLAICVEKFVMADSAQATEQLNIQELKIKNPLYYCALLECINESCFISPTPIVPTFISPIPMTTPIAAPAPMGEPVLFSADTEIMSMASLKEQQDEQKENEIILKRVESMPCINYDYDTPLVQIKRANSFSFKMD